MSEKRSKPVMQPDDVRKLYCEDGYTRADLCQHYGVTVNQLTNFLNMNEIRKKDRLSYLESTIPHQKIKTAYEDGRSIEFLADEFDLSLYHVRKSLEGQGVTIRANGWIQDRQKYAVGTFAADLGTGMKNWYDVPGYEGLYKMSDDRELASFKRSNPRILNGRLARDRAVAVRYYKLLKQGKLRVHRQDVLAISVFGQEATG